MNKFSYDAVWTDLVSMARTNASVLSILAGAFLLLPNFAQLLFAPPPEILAFDMNAMKAMNDYVRENFVTLILCNLPVWLGSGAILALLLDPRRLTVGEALTSALWLLASVILLTWLTQLAVYGGFALLLVPGLYLVGRLAVAAASQMAERLKNPFAALGRSLALTRGNGWRVAGIVCLLWVVATIVGAVVNRVIGIILMLVLPASAEPTGEALLRAAVAGTIALLMLLLSAAIYRQLAPVPAVPA